MQGILVIKRNKLLDKEPENEDWYTYFGDEITLAGIAFDLDSYKLALL